MYGVGPRQLQVVGDARNDLLMEEHSEYMLIAGNIYLDVGSTRNEKIRTGSRKRNSDQ